MKNTEESIETADAIPVYHFLFSSDEFCAIICKAKMAIKNDIASMT